MRIIELGYVCFDLDQFVSMGMHPTANAQGENDEWTLVVTLAAGKPFVMLAAEDEIKQTYLDVLASLRKCDANPGKPIHL